MSVSLPAGRSAMSLRLMSTAGMGTGAGVISGSDAEDAEEEEEEEETVSGGVTGASSARARRLKRLKASSAISDATHRRK